MSKHAGQRSCMGCNKQAEKGKLIRILRTPEGEVVLDSTGKANGRGAYICRSADCLKRVRKSKRLSRSLKTDISDDVYNKLESEVLAYAQSDGTTGDKSQGRTPQDGI